MSISNMNIGFFFIVYLTSVVHNSKIEKNDSVISEIVKNITIVNHFLHDLMRKYTHLKDLEDLLIDKYKHRTETKFDEVFKGKSDFNQKAKVKLKDYNTNEKFDGKTDSYSDQTSEDNASEFYYRVKENGTDEKNIKHPEKSGLIFGYPQGSKKTIIYSDTSSEKKKDETNNNEKPHKEEFNKKKYSISEIREDTVKNKNEKTNPPNDYSDDEISCHPEEIVNPKEIKKVLVIHLGTTDNFDVKKSRALSKNRVYSQSNPNKEYATKSILFRSNTKTHSDSDMEEKTVIKEEILRARTLQRALGDACTKLVNRKCKNALKEVLKDVCKKERKCKSKFNEDFTKNGISACDKQFADSNNRKHEKYFRGDNEYDDDDEDSKAWDRGQDQELNRDRFVDYTRQGLVHMACLQALSDVKQPKATARTNTTNVDNKTQNFHILRDNLETACRKASFDKCEKACKTATNQTCKQHECVKEKEKAFNKRCNKRCKEVYEYVEKGSSESTSESEEEDDEGSD